MALTGTHWFAFEKLPLEDVVGCWNRATIQDTSLHAE